MKRAGTSSPRLTLGETRLLFRLVAEEHDKSERAEQEADERLRAAREEWEGKTRLAE